MKMNKYLVYLDDGEMVYKLAIPATSKAKARQYVQGNGEIIKVEETQGYISLHQIAQALQNAHFGQMEIDFITRALGEIGIAE